MQLGKAKVLKELDNFDSFDKERVFMKAHFDV